MVLSLALVHAICEQSAFRSAVHKFNTSCFLEMVLQSLKCLCLDDINHNNVVHISMHQYHLNYYSHWGLRACCSIHICAFYDHLNTTETCCTMCVLHLMTCLIVLTNSIAEKCVNPI